MSITETPSDSTTSGAAAIVSSNLDRFTAIRILEGYLFASAAPVALEQLSELLTGSPYAAEDKLEELLGEVETLYAQRGVNLVRIKDAVAFRTAADIAVRMTIHRKVTKKLSRAGLETLAIIAYHQPVTRPEIEEIRGVALSRGTLDLLLEQEWIAPAGRRMAPGKPLQWAVTQHFLDYFELESLDDLPGVEELKEAGLLDRRGTLAAAGLGGAGLSGAGLSGAGLSGAGLDDDTGGNPLDNVDVEGVEELVERPDLSQDDEPAQDAST